MVDLVEVVLPLEINEVDEFEQLEMKNDKWEAQAADRKHKHFLQRNMDGEMMQKSLKLMNGKVQ